MKILFIGCVQFSHATLQHLLSVPEAEVVGVVTRRESPMNADFRSLEPLARENGIPVHIAAGNDQGAIAAWIRSRKPEVAYCFGWSYLLGQQILDVPPLGVVGYHPAPLPRNRGRHPIIWTLALGLSETASTFFFMDEGADSGDILDQRSVAVDEDDDASALYDKLTSAALAQIAGFTPLLAAGRYHRVRQDHAKANYWRKRGRKDGEIDWRMSARGVHNLVRALGRPYPGAHCVHRTEEIRIWRTEIVSPPRPAIENLEPGKVLEVDDRAIVVKCGEGAVRLLEHEFQTIPEQGAYL